MALLRNIGIASLKAQRVILPKLFCEESRLFSICNTSSYMLYTYPKSQVNALQVIKRFHGDHSLDNDDPIMQTKEMKSVTYMGLGMNVVLTGAKAVLGFLMNSSSVIADAAHSMSDMISDVVTLGTVHYSRRPPNKKWIYGYGKLETVVSSLFVGGILIATSGAVFMHAYDLISSLYFVNPETLHTIEEVVCTAQSHSHGVSVLTSSSNLLNGLGVGILVASIGMKEWLYKITMKIAISADSSVLKANAWHHRVDALSAVVALLGLSGRFIGMPWLDPVGGVVVGAVVLNTGCNITWKSLGELVDLSVDKETLDSIRHVTCDSIDKAFVDRIVVKDVVARKAGPHIHSVVRLDIDNTMTVDDMMTVKHQIEHNLRSMRSMQSVVVDLNTNCECHCKSSCCHDEKNQF